MPRLSYPLTPQPYTVGMAPRRVRPEFGKVLFAFMPIAPNQPLSTKMLIEGGDNLSLVVAAPQTTQPLVSNRFGIAQRLAGTGSVGTNPIWGGGYNWRAGFNPSKLTVLMVGTPWAGSNLRPIFGSSQNGFTCGAFILGPGSGASTLDLWFGASESAYGNSINGKFASVTSGYAESFVWTWKAGVSLDLFRSGKAGTVISNTASTLGDSAYINQIGTSDTYAPGFDLNLVLVSDRNIPKSLAYDLSHDPDIAFEPERHSFYFSAGGGGATTKTVSITLQNAAGAVQQSLTGLRWAFFDDVTPDTLVAPTDQGTGETTDGSGVLTVTLTNSALTNGQTGYLIVSDTDGTTTQSPSHKGWQGPVTVVVS